MNHVLDELELYTLGVLTPQDRDRVATHLAACGACREAADALGGVVEALADTVADREPPEALRERILATARGDLRAPRVVPTLRPWLPTAALAAAAIALAVLNVNSARELSQRDAELASSRDIAECVSQGGRTWAMRGIGQWTTAGGLLVARGAAPACVVFHDLAAAPTGYSYTVWLIDQEGRWVRGSSFAPRGAYQMVDVGMSVEGFDQCSVTLETRTQGKREGPVVMQSRIYQGAPPAQ